MRACCCHLLLSLYSLLLLLAIITTPSTAAAAAAKTPKASSKTDFIDCSDPCNGGDVNYELVASVRTMKMMNYTYRGRTYSNPESSSEEEDISFMGPTMRVAPGQSLWIKHVNNMDDPTLGPHEPTAEDYWRMLENPGEHIKYQRYKKRVKHYSELKVDWPNLPQHFDATNLHLHGLDVEVHMFDPVGTHNPEAPHIVIEPGQCYCYKFHVPKHHPPGLYWYHPHLHGSTALQIWSGMLGLLYVEGPLLDELAEYGITNTHEFVIWDPAFKAVENKQQHHQQHNLEVDEFLMGQTTLSKIHPFLVNGKMNPTFQTAVGQVLHLRVLCGTIENENTFIVYKEGEEDLHWDEAPALPFWVIGSDGVTYRKPRRRNILVMAGGQREELLLQFDEPGRYVISQQGIQGMQFFDMRGHPHDQILATIVVVEQETTTDATDSSSVRPTMPISQMTFTPGYEEDEAIQASDIVASETIVFSMGANLDQAPFPQYYVNGRPFDPDRLDFFAHPGEAREYILINANHNVHPFHIHVNRFQIKEMGTELSSKTYPVLDALVDFDPDVWRDTVVVPPNGRARIWVQYKNYTGKTLLHCHFLAHEDTGMMSTLFIGPPDVVFHWRDHVQLLVGIGIGVIAATAVVVTMAFVGGATKRQNGAAYTAVAMNELKSKTMD